MIKTIVVLSIILFVSLLVNALLMWYTRTTLKKLLFISENFSFLKRATTIYADNLKSVYQLDSYHGDETIKFLFEHTKGLVQVISEFDDIIVMTEQQELMLDDREIEIEGPSNTTQEEEAPTSLEGPNEKHVFYVGSRRSDS
jgi:hypothetical protein